MAVVILLKITTCFVKAIMVENIVAEIAPIEEIDRGRFFIKVPGRVKCRVKGEIK